MVWNSRDIFIKDPSIVLIGYQANFKELTEGLFYFDHKECGNTLALKTGMFRDLYNRKIFNESKLGTTECLGYCNDKDNLKRCPAKCECAYVREIMQLLK